MAGMEKPAEWLKQKINPSCLFLSNKIFQYGARKKKCTEKMITISKLGKLALSRFARKVKARITFKEDEIPFGNFLKNSKSGLHPASISTSYTIYLWDWEYGLSTTFISDKLPLGILIRDTLTSNENSIFRTEMPRASHLAVLVHTYQTSGDGNFDQTDRELQVYGFHKEKLNMWLASCKKHMADLDPEIRKAFEDQYA